MRRIDPDPPVRVLREFGASGALVLAILGAWRAGDWPAAAIAASWVAAGGLAVAAAAAPRALRPVWIAACAVALPVGWLLSRVLLAAIYYGVVTPLGWIARLAGHDPLQRRIDRTAPTYWAPRPPPPPPERHLRQY
jgi:hypothetical protein